MYCLEYNYMFSYLNEYVNSSHIAILNNALDIAKGNVNLNSTMKYFHSMSEYMLELRKVLEELRDDIEYVLLLNTMNKCDM